MTAEPSEPGKVACRNPRPLRRRILPFTTLVLCVFAAAAPARADVLDDVLSLLAMVGLIDSVVVEAKPIIECVVAGGNVAECTNAVAHVKAEAKSALAPNDPRIKQVIDIYNAVLSSDWLKVFRLGGSTVVCGVVPGGTVKDFFCGELADLILTAAGDKAEAVYNAIKKGDWWALIQLANPDMVCSILPPAVHAVLCNEFLAAVGKAAEFAADAAGAVASAINNLGEDLLTGQTQHIPPGEYYQSARRHALHDMIVQRVVYNKPGDQYFVVSKCVEYFDSHKMSNSNAKKVCGDLRNKLEEEVQAGVTYATSAVDAYFLGRLQPNARAFAAETYGKVEDIRAKVVSVRNSHQQWRHATFHPVSAPFAAAFNACTVETYKQHTLPAASGGLQIYNWICIQAVGEKFSEELLKGKAWLDNDLRKQLAACSGGPNAVGGQLQFSCATYRSYRDCRSEFSTLGVADKQLIGNCGIDLNKAVPNEASRIARALGAKRCRVVGAGTSSAAVVCERPWKRRACLAMEREATHGLPYMYTSVKCRFETTTRGPQNFTQQSAEAAAIAVKLNAALPSRSQAEPSCRTLADPLAIRCRGLNNVAEVNALVSGLALKTCPADPGNDGADEVCYSALTDAQWSLQQYENQPLQPVQPAQPPQRQNRSL